MRQHTYLPTLALVTTVVALCLQPAIKAQSGAAVSLQEQLNAQYKPAKLEGSVFSGSATLKESGTLLAVQKGGIISVPWKGKVLCAAKFQDNTLHPSVGFCAGMVKSVSQYFAKGNKVYPLKVEVNPDKAKISFQVVSCDSCNGVDPPTGMKGEVIFQFPKGYLEKASAGEVEDVIGQVFAVSTGDDQQAENGGNAGQQQAAEQQQPAQQEQQAEPQTVQMGMTTQQVESVLGKPDKIFNVGAKQLYVYKDVKVTFMNGKVSDVQ